jgi:ketosteroid isomerase-like protein
MLDAGSLRSERMNVFRSAALMLMLGCASGPAVAADSAGATAVRQLLQDFMAGAGQGDPALFERFFADDLLYTRASGVLVTKANILDSLRTPHGPETSRYTAEDVTLHEYGDTIVVAFRLEGSTEVHGQTEHTHYRNTGVFLHRNGRWQAVAWQATPADGR